MSLAIWMKQLGQSLSAQAISMLAKVSDAQIRQQGLNDLVAIINQFVRAILSDKIQQKYKQNIQLALYRLLNTFTDLCFSTRATSQTNVNFSDFYYNFVRDLAQFIEASLGQINQKETVMGALNITECFLSVLQQEAFQVAFEALSGKLRELAESVISNFQTDIAAARAQVPPTQQVILSADNVLAVRLMHSLEILRAWSTSV